MIESVNIRAAKRADYNQASPLILQAMEDIACFYASSENALDALPLFEYFFQEKSNLYSFENTLVYQTANELQGTLTVYDGSILSHLRKPILDYLKNKQGIVDFNPEYEADEDEFYIDCR